MVLLLNLVLRRELQLLGWFRGTVGVANYGNRTLRTIFFVNSCCYGVVGVVVAHHTLCIAALKCNKRFVRIVSLCRLGPPGPRLSFTSSPTRTCCCC